MSQDFLSFPNGAVAVVTGAGAGIGRAIAEMLVAADVRVAGWDLVPAGVEELQAAHPDRFHAGVLDVTDEKAVRRALESAESRWGGVAHLVNNAGPPSGADLGFSSGLAASLGSVECVTSAWLETAGAEGGSVVNIASISGNLIGVGGHSWYPSAKAGIVGYTRFLAAHRPKGIRANAVAPGVTATPRTRASLEGAEWQQMIQRNPSHRPAAPRDIAAAVVFLLAPVSDYTNGIFLPVDGGATLAL